MNAILNLRPLFLLVTYFSFVPLYVLHLYVMSLISNQINCRKRALLFFIILKFESICCSSILLEGYRCIEYKELHTYNSDRYCREQAENYANFGRCNVFMYDADDYMCACCGLLAITFLFDDGFIENLIITPKV